MRVTYGQCRAFFFGIVDGQGELLSNGAERLLVVQKNIARGGGNSRFLRGGFGYRGRRCPAIDELEITQA